MLNTRKAIENIRKQIDKLEQAIDQDGVPVDAPLYFIEVAKQAVIGAVSVHDEFGQK